MKIAALGHIPVIVRIGAAMQKHPAVARDAQTASLGKAADNHCRTLIDEGIGIHEAGIRIRDVGIVGCELGNSIAVEAVATIGQRIACGHFGKARQQLAHRMLMLSQAVSGMRPDCIFEERVHVDRSTRAMSFLNIRPAALCHPP